MLTYALAVLAACSNAVSSVLQRKANREAPQGQNLSLKLIWSLAHEPVWFGGALTITAGFLLQAAALGGGELSIVEPILVLELPATLILASRVFCCSRVLRPIAFHLHPLPQPRVACIGLTISYHDINRPVHPGELKIGAAYVALSGPELAGSKWQERCLTSSSGLRTQDGRLPGAFR
jgi:hypothetical protein